MGTGSLIQGEDQISKSNYNNKFILADTAAIIEAMSPTALFAGMVCSPTTDGTNLKKGGVYVWDATNSTWVDQKNPVHLHNSTTAGGFLSDVLAANDPYLWNISETNLIFQVTNGSGVTFPNTVSGTDAYRAVTTGSSASAGTYTAGGLRYDFAYPLTAHFRAVCSTVTSSYTTRIGFNMEFAHITANATKRLGIEACDSCNGANLRVVSADGSTRSASNTSDSASAAATYKLVYNPTVPNLSYYKNSGSAVVKSSNMFNTGSPDKAACFVAGVQTTNSTPKTLQMWGLRAFGTMNRETTEWV